MSNAASTTATATTKTYTLVWGWYANSLVRETFTSRAAAWTRVQELMAKKAAPWAGAPERHVCTLEIYTARADGKPGKEITSFKRYEAGSKFCKWGEWGSTTCKTTGECFG